MIFEGFWHLNTAYREELCQHTFTIANITEFEQNLSFNNIAHITGTCYD